MAGLAVHDPHGCPQSKVASYREGPAARVYSSCVWLTWARQGRRDAMTGYLNVMPLAASASGAASQSSVVVAIIVAAIGAVATFIVGFLNFRALDRLEFQDKIHACNFVANDGPLHQGDRSAGQREPGRSDRRDIRSRTDSPRLIERSGLPSTYFKVSLIRWPRSFGSLNRVRRFKNHPTSQC